jgi:AraC-like DNA-binding protein
MLIDQVSVGYSLFFILYGITGIVPLIAAVYLLFRRRNAIAPGVTPPLRLRRWAASFFIVSALCHVWWYWFYVNYCDIHSVSYLLAILFDYVGMVTTIAGTMLSMLQDRRRSLWPIFVSIGIFMVLIVLEMYYPHPLFRYVITAYNVAFLVIFSVYMLFAVRKYDCWLNDNYADLENKKVWLSQAVSLAFMFLFVLYALSDTFFTLLYLVHLFSLVFYVLLLWRVETLPQLDTITQPQQSQDVPVNIDLNKIERLLVDRCVNTQIYRQHDLNLQQLAQSIGTNRFYLSQYFSRQGITYNIYINNLRINYFITRYHESVSSMKPFTVLQLSRESGFRSYSTFSLAFKQRTGRSVTAWISELNR